MGAGKGVNGQLEMSREELGPGGRGKGNGGILKRSTAHGERK